MFVPEGQELFRYIDYAQTRWRFIAACGAAAFVLALAASLSLTRQYTASAKILIEPPAGNDPRASIAVSPIYLESLRTYEYLASSDSLFLRAVERFGLRRMLGTLPIESLKKKALKISVVRNTRILEISATLPDARAAQALAQFVAESTVALNLGLLSAGDRDLMKGAEQAEADAEARLKELAARKAGPDGLEPERRAAQDALAKAESRLYDARANAGSRGERLTVIDPGVVPERPSWPNVPLNAGVALLVGLGLPVLYLAFEMNYTEQHPGHAPLPAASGGEGC